MGVVAAVVDAVVAVGVAAGAEEVLSHRKALLGETLTSQETLNFTTALRQIMIQKENLKSIETHTFSKTPVKRLFDFSGCEIPTVCLSISPKGLDLDNSFHPVRDTCGCSFHGNLERAIFGALKESIERQFLLKFWLTREFARKLDLPFYREKLDSPGALSLFNALLSIGDVTAFDITDQNFPGKCVIVLFGTDDAQHYVHYCAGMAYSDSTESAFEKAIYELWQTFRFIRDFHISKSDVSTIKDPYLSHFLNCNSYSTYLEITDATCEVTTQPASADRPFTVNELRAAIIQSGIDGYLYIQPTTITRKPYFFCKYTSPTAFMHMNNACHINIRNNYSKIFLNKINKTRQQSMVPFP